MRRTPCPGCHIRYSSHALALHLAQTANPICRAIYQRDNAYLPGAVPLSGGESDSEPESPQGGSFEGDFFGTRDDYDEDEFPGPWSDDDAPLHVLPDDPALSDGSDHRVISGCCSPP